MVKDTVCAEEFRSERKVWYKDNDSKNGGIHLAPPIEELDELMITSRKRDEH